MAVMIGGCVSVIERVLLVWGLTPSFAAAPLHSVAVIPLHCAPPSANIGDRPCPGGASETVPTRSRAGLTAAPKACLPTGSSRRVAPSGCVPFPPPRCLRRHPVVSPRTAEQRDPRGPLAFFPAGQPRELARRNITALAGPIGA